MPCRQISPNLWRERASRWQGARRCEGGGGGGRREQEDGEARVRTCGVVKAMERDAALQQELYNKRAGDLPTG